MEQQIVIGDGHDRQEKLSKAFTARIGIWGVVVAGSAIGLYVEDDGVFHLATHFHYDHMADLNHVLKMADLKVPRTIRKRSARMMLRK